ncbi:hypothetical protein BJ166DRAFT_341624 [Pestalotiopsis sp. NC0098]|nr:hypothetical protein BJ166DRAFT_341624 [Pestalotiopsis sp. NC0098]
MDVDSAKTRLYSSSIHSSITKVGENNEWCGHPPCVCYNSSLGCYEHNSSRLPTYRNALLPPKKQDHKPSLGIFDSIRSRFQGPKIPEDVPGSTKSDAKPQSLFFSSLPFDLSSVDTLTPMHPSIPYHLAFYHLDCIRRQLDPGVSIAFIPELSCNGFDSLHKNGPRFAWSSEIYFHDGTFLQKQELCCVIERDSNAADFRLRQCPHAYFKVGQPTFDDEDGWLVARSRIEFPRPRGTDYVYTEWKSKEGRFDRIRSCTKCHSDHEQILEVVGRRLHVRNTCYRDLGSGTDRSQPKWISLLTGKVPDHQRFYYHPGLDQVYGHVWRTANKLGRPNLHVVIHKLRHGEFDVSASPQPNR